MAGQGLLIVVSAPSGAGKHALVTRLQEMEPNVVTAVSATTRPPRPGEEHGRDYYFVDRPEFERRRDAGDMVEWAEVHGNLYGTLAAELDRCLASGRDVIVEVDVQGMRNLKRLRDDMVSVFLMPPSMEELEARLRKRGTNDEADIAVRLKNARGEMAAKDEFDYVITNDDLDRAAAEMAGVIHRQRPGR